MFGLELTEMEPKDCKEMIQEFIKINNQIGN